MKKYLLQSLMFLATAAFAQAPLELNPLEMPAVEVKARGIKMMECIEGNYKEEERSESYDVNRVYFEEQGNVRRIEEHHFSKGQLSDGMEEDRSYRYVGDSIGEIHLEEYKFVPSYTRTSTYVEGRLKETKEERGMRKNNYREYTYDEKGRILQVAFSTIFTAVEKYFYEKDRLIKTAYFRMEDDSIPKTETFYQYYENGERQQKLEIHRADQDTLLLVKYDSKGQVSYLLKQMESGSHGFTYEDSFDYEAYYSSDAEGNITQIKYTAPQFFASDRPRDSLIWTYANYQFSDGLLMSFDSAGIHHEVVYDDQKRLIRYLGFQEPNRDTAFVEEYKYNEQDQLIEVMRWYHMEGESFKWVYAYEAGHRVRASYLQYFRQRKCVIKRAYDPELRRLQIKDYCRLNRQGLPADVPDEIQEKYFDAKGNLTYKIHQYSKQDGSLHNSGADSLIYQNGRLIQVYNISFGSYGIAILNTYHYGEKGLLDRILTTYESDTLKDRTFTYQAGKLLQEEFKIFDLHKKKKYTRIHEIFDYNSEEQLIAKKTHKIIQSPYGEYTTQINFFYNEQGLLQLQSQGSSDWRGDTEFRKTYRYVYF